MARSCTVRFVDYLNELERLTIGGVSSYDIFKSWMDTTKSRSEIYPRLLMFKSFVSWADQNFYTFDEWNAEIFTKWGDHLRDIGNKPYSIKIKLSNIRQVLLAAQSEGIIPKVIYFQRRGPKQRNPETRLVVMPKQPVTKPKCNSKRLTEQSKFDRSFLYSLFDLNEGFTSDQLKQAFKRIAFRYHPDRNQSPNASKQFLACREVYSYLSDYENRSQYDSFIRQKRGRPNQTVMDFVSEMFNVFSA